LNPFLQAAQQLLGAFGGASPEVSSTTSVLRKSNGDQSVILFVCFFFRTREKGGTHT
jgi:hypothetical protein